MSSLPFTPRLPPLDYQEHYLTNYGLVNAHGLIWHQGTGKTKALIDNKALLLYHGMINGSFVLAPNGVHRNWVVEELPKHWPGDMGEYYAFEWNTSKASGKRYQQEFQDFLAYTQPGEKEGRLRGGQPIGILCMSYDGMMTDAGKQASWAFLRRRTCLYAADESQRFKEPSSKRNRRVFASSAYAPFKRIASGTPMDKPFDIYPQMRWLDEDFWKKTMGIDSFTAFKAHIGNWRKMTLNNGTVIDVLREDIPYQHLDELEAVISTITTRVTEEVAEAALPPKTYRRIVHELSEAQRRAYDEIAEECLTMLDSGQIVTAEHVLTQRLRLAQIGAGFVTPEAGAQPVLFPSNPRRDAVSDLLLQLGPGEPTLQWCMFKPDEAALIEAARRAGRTAVVYDAARPGETLEAWKRGEYHDLIGSLYSGLTEGHTLIRAAHCLYYTNTPRLIARQQSEKRPHRIGQVRGVTYYDFLAAGTQDEANLEAVRKKARWTGETLGDNPEIAKAWLRATIRGGVYEAPAPAEIPGRAVSQHLSERAPGQMEIDFSDYEEAMSGRGG